MRAQDAGSSLGFTPTIPLASSSSRAKSIPASWPGSRNCGATAVVLEVVILLGVVDRQAFWPTATAFSRAAAACGVPVAIDTAVDGVGGHGSVRAVQTLQAQFTDRGNGLEVGVETHQHSVVVQGHSSHQ